MREVAIIGVCAAVLGGVLGFAVPVSAAVTGHVYLAEMLSPSGNTYQLVQLNCGWHTGACDSPSESGINLDWDNTSSYNVSFRGWFTRTGAPDNETIRLDGIVAQVSGGPIRL